MDPITAYALLAKSVVEMVTQMIEGQSPEQKAKIWEWFIEDQARWRRWLHLDAAP